MVTRSLRQIHLDFHTSPLITNLATAFDPADFAHTLRQAHVDSVTCFAKCHHGMSYYPTSIGVRHPGLTRDLLGEQIAACHTEGIKAPVYLSVVWDEHAAAHHPEWRQVTVDGRLAGRQPFEAHGWRYLCMNSPYLDYVAAQTAELLDAYALDGLFFDIVMETEPACVCERCLVLMDELGLDPTRPQDLRQKARIVAQRAMARLTALVHARQPEASIFYNSRLRFGADPDTSSAAELRFQTHVEIESLPSGGWGYNHFPLYARVFSQYDRPMLGMTARFHKTWSDFGGLKSHAALSYECMRMLAAGAGCSIGDQLHPRGALEKPVYARIGQVYERVRALEPFLIGATPMAEIGVLITSDADAPGGLASRSDEGALRMLMEEHAQFALLDRAADLRPFKLIIAPDAVQFDAALAANVADYLNNGGAMLLSHRSGLRPDGAAFMLDTIGVRVQGALPTIPTYLRLDPAFAEAGSAPIPGIDHVLYDDGLAVLPEADTTTLGTIVAAYFTRSWRSFSSHHQAPPAAPTPYAGITRHGQVIYLAHPLFRAYAEHGAPVYRQIIATALRLLLPEPLLVGPLPTTVEATVQRQGARQTIHLLHYVPQRRAPGLDIVEDALPIAPTTVALRVARPPRRVYLAPDGPDLASRYADNYCQIELPLIIGHAVVVVE